MSLSTFYQHRFKFYFGVFFCVFSLGVIVIKFVENKSWLDSVYFVIVTLSTVGYGDIIPSKPLSKIMSIVLITTGISIFALLSQEILDMIVQNRIQSHILPKKPIGYKNHIVLGGYSSIGKRIGDIIRERGFQVVVVDKDSKRVAEAVYDRFPAIQADISQLQTLKILSLEDASAVFLALNNDNDMAKATILMKNLNEFLPVYAEIDSPTSEAIVRVINLDQGVTLPHVSKIAVLRHMFHAPLVPLNGQWTKSSIGNVQIFYGLSHEVKKIFPNSLVIGKYSLTTESFFPLHSDVFDVTAKYDLIAVPIADLDNAQSNFPDEKELEFNQVVFGGYNELNRNLLKEMNITTHKILAICEYDNQISLTTEDGIEGVVWDLENCDDQITSVLTPHDLVICNFDNVTTNLIFVTTVKKHFPDTHIIQQVKYDEEVDTFLIAGVNGVITPQRTISTYLINTFLEKKRLPQSFIFANGQIFEARYGDLKKLQKKIKEKMELLAITTENAVRRLNKKSIQEDDMVLIYVEEEYSKPN